MTIFKAEIEIICVFYLDFFITEVLQYKYITFIQSSLEMRCYLGLGVLSNMREQAYYSDAFNGVLEDSLVDRIENINNISRIELINDLYDTVTEEVSSKLFYIRNYIIESNRYIKQLKFYSNAIFSSDNIDDQSLAKANIYKFSQKSEVVKLFKLGYTAEQVLLILSDDLGKLKKSQFKLIQKYLDFQHKIQLRLSEYDELNPKECLVYRGQMGFFKEFPKAKSHYSKALLKDFFSDINLYFNFSKKLKAVPAEISPVISPRLLQNFRSILNQPKTYESIINDLAESLGVSAKQIIIIDRDLRNELVPIPNKGEKDQEDFYLKQLSVEIHYLYYVDRPDFNKYLEQIDAFVDGVRPVPSVKRQEQYFHVFNTLHKEDFNGFDEYLEILRTHGAEETKVYYDFYCTRTNSVLLNMLETITSNFEYVYINNTNSLWHCTHKLKAREYLLPKEVKN